MTLDVTEISVFQKTTNPGVDFDGNYTFYYDETNNIKKLHLKSGDFNVAFTSNFILGGLCFSGEKPDISDVFDEIKFQDNITEVKFKHLATGDFLDCLKSSKLTPFLDYLVKSPLYLHYSTLNLLYYSIVDIVDSALDNAPTYYQAGPGFNRYLKDILYKVCKGNIDTVISVFFSGEYPNVKPEELNNFIQKLIDILNQYRPTEEEAYGLSVLKIILQKSIDEKLVFIQDETNYMLIGGLGQFYWRPVYTFSKSTHHFDNEDEIRKEMENLEIILDGHKLENYTFMDSKSDKYIQCSDIIVGLTGKLSKFLNTHSHEEITVHVSSLNEKQINNLDLYLDLYTKSLKRNIAFIHSTDSNEEMSKLILLCDLRGKTF
jgi:hypothetical protein